MGPKTILYKAFGLFCALGLEIKRRCSRGGCKREYKGHFGAMAWPYVRLGFFLSLDVFRFARSDSLVKRTPTPKLLTPNPKLGLVPRGSKIDVQEALAAFYVYG